MKGLIILSCLVAMCLAVPFPGDDDEVSVGDVAGAVKKSEDNLGTKRLWKRSADVTALFNMMDTNSDGHVTCDEFAAFYVVWGPRYGYYYTRTQWKAACQKVMSYSFIDRNNNDTIEPDELLTIYYIGLAG